MCVCMCIIYIYIYIQNCFMLTSVSIYWISNQYIERKYSCLGYSTLICFTLMKQGFDVSLQSNILIWEDMLSGFNRWVSLMVVNGFSSPTRQTHLFCSNRNKVDSWTPNDSNFPFCTASHWNIEQFGFEVFFLCIIWITAEKVWKLQWCHHFHLISCYR